MSDRKSVPPHSCGRCERRWDGLAEAHCTSCCRHFGSVTAFDVHRTGPVDDRQCADPAVLVRRDGYPRLSPVQRTSGPTWVVFHTQPHPQARLSDARRAAIGNLEESW